MGALQWGWNKLEFLHGDRNWNGPVVQNEQADLVDKAVHNPQ